METSLARTEQTYIRLLFGGLAALVILGALCWGGVRLYQHWQEGHLVRRAAAIMSAGDLKTASLSARRALQLNPQSAPAMRIMADIGERTSDRTTLDWRRKVWDLNRNSVEDGLALVRGALWFRDGALAEKTLAAIAPIAGEKAEFHAASARVAELKKDAATAERHWARAAELGPQDSVYRFQLALVRLGSTDAGRRAKALATLHDLRADPGQRTGATRALILDGISHHADPQQTRVLAKELQDYPETLFSDRILYVEILRQAADPLYDEYLRELKAKAPGQASECAALLAWMTRNGMNAEAAEFAGTLPAEMTTKWPVPLAAADAFAQAKDWAALMRLTKEGNWAGYDFLRKAFLSRAYRSQAMQLAAEQELAAAEREVSANPQALSLLTQTIADWGWQNEAIEMLWALTKNPEAKMPALQTLYEHYTKAADTPGLFRVLSKLAEINPHDRPLQNNLAQVSLLLGAEVERARKIAADLAAQEPTNAAYLSTYAFALFTKGDLKGGLQVMDGLTEEQLRDPSIATYYGLLLASVGQKDKARAMLNRSDKANLLPEEKALVSRAESSLN